MRSLEHRIPPPIVVVVVAAAMWLSRSLDPRVDPGELMRWIVSGAIVLCGLFAARAGVQAFARAKTTINPVSIEAASSLVTTGIFAYTRNPMYLGMAILLLGWAVFLGSAWAYLGPIAFVLFITRFQIQPEERMLAAKFGPAYDAYRRAVRRWI